MDARNVTLRDLQQLNDAIAVAMDAIQRISPQLQSGLSHTAYAPLTAFNPAQAAFTQAQFLPTQVSVDPFGMVRGIDHSAFAARAAFGTQLVPTTALLNQVPVINTAFDPFGRGIAHSNLTTAPLANPLLSMAGIPGVQFVPVRSW